MRSRIAGSKYDGAIDAALKLKNGGKVVKVPSNGMKFDSLSIGLRLRVAGRKLRNTIHVEQNKQTKEIVIVKGRSLFKQTGAHAGNPRGRKKPA
jgi:hypothetical protein